MNFFSTKYLDRGCENAYGRNFESILQSCPEEQRHWLRIEEALQVLDPFSQKIMKNKVCKYLIKKARGPWMASIF